MKIKLYTKPVESIPTTHTRVVCIESGVERIIVTGKEITLEIVSGKQKNITPRTFRTLIRNIIQSAKKNKIEKIALSIQYSDFPKCSLYGEKWFWSTIVENMLLAEYEYTIFKSKKHKRNPSEVLLVTAENQIIRDSITRGTIVGSFANICRDISNTPGGDMTPSILAHRTKTTLKGTKTHVTVLDEAHIKKLKMGGLLGVGKGASDGPRFIIIEYKGPNSSKKNATQKSPIVFVGKGVTFDTGGLQIKPGMAMYEMHMDMSGGAAVIAAIGAIATLKLPIHVVGLIPAAENAVSDTSIRPGDVLTMMSGTTVDVLHTDAEGRLILADALHYARRYNPRLVVDVATLTGASLVALGQHAHVIMTKDRDLEDTFRELGEESGDYTFPLPLWNEFRQYIKGVHGDITNIPVGDPRYGGTVNAGTFLSHFTKKMKWVHIDMAPRMTSVLSDKLAKGATGEPTRLLVKIAEHFC